jgi:hypothetical protein
MAIQATRPERRQRLACDSDGQIKGERSVRQRARPLGAGRRKWQSWASPTLGPISLSLGRRRHLSGLFSAVELTFESERALEVALQLFRKGSADFADCLHVALATQVGEQPL